MSLEISIKGKDTDEVRAFARWLIAQRPDLSPAIDSGKNPGSGEFVAVVHTRNFLENPQTRQKA